MKKIIICIQDVKTNNIDIVCKVTLDELLNVNLDTCDKRTALLLESLSKAEKIIFKVHPAMDLFNDGYSNCSIDVRAYREADNDLSEYGINWIMASCYLKKGEVFNPTKINWQQTLGGQCFGMDDEVSVIQTLNLEVKKAIIAKIVSYGKVEKCVLVFENAKTGDKSTTSSFMNMIKNNTKAKSNK